ncbi:hypothetical protein Bbelb_296570 [Branchiostoma belcheri]|nr:hypothetical protein Bbelb_296570 [Branchiostoma belcheri]
MLTTPTGPKTSKHTTCYVDYLLTFSIFQKPEILPTLGPKFPQNNNTSKQPRWSRTVKRAAREFRSESSVGRTGLPEAHFAGTPSAEDTCDEMPSAAGVETLTEKNIVKMSALPSEDAARHLALTSGRRES